MSDCIIRFGGDYCSDSSAIKNLITFIQKKESHIFLVISTNAQIQGILEESLENVFKAKANPEKTEEELLKVFKKIAKKPATSKYSETAGNIKKLLQGIILTGDYSAALKDQFFSYGELLTAQIFFSLISEYGVDSDVLSLREYGFLLSSDFGNASYLSIDSEKLRKLSTQKAFIIPGSQGITAKGKISRPGLSATDYTAAALASALDADELILWGLKNSFFSADPNLIPEPKKITRLTYSEASELAYFDHYSLHPRTVEPLEEKHIPIKVYNPKTLDVETVINTETFISNEIIKGVAYSDDVSLLKLDGPGVGLKPGILSRAATALSEEGINVRSVITSQVSINFILGEKEGEKALEIIGQLGFNAVKEIDLVKEVTLIGIVGHGMQHNYGVSARLFTAVAENKINVLLSGSGASDLVSYLVINRSDRNKSIQQIYRAFLLTKDPVLQES